MRRIAFYSYDEQGLGHVRRSIAIAHAVSGAGRASILLIAGAREAALFPLPPGTDTLALPAPSTDFNGRRREASLGLDVAGTIRMRARTLRAALAAYEPDVLVVDGLPLGSHDELNESLGLLRTMGTRLVFGMREVLDDPAYVRAEWDRSDVIGVLRRSYDAIWVYGDPRVFDPAVEYDLPDDLRAIVRYSGYLDRRAAEQPHAGEHAARRSELGLPAGRLALCLLGGGEDGHHLAAAFARAQLPAGYSGAIITGPFMPDGERDALHELVRDRRDLRVLDFVPDADGLIALADDVVAMGGYNTICEILGSGARALVVPRAEPRREQLIRAQRLHALGALDVLTPHEAGPTAISSWLAAGGARRAPLQDPIDMDGLRRVPALLDEVLAAPGRHDTPASTGRFRRMPGERGSRRGSLSR
jgi:predicted glycosyltransferase